MTLSVQWPGRDRPSGGAGGGGAAVARWECAELRVGAIGLEVEGGQETMVDRR
jgi:hypothetical protein